MGDVAAGSECYCFCGEGETDEKGFQATINAATPLTGTPPWVADYRGPTCPILTDRPEACAILMNAFLLDNWNAQRRQLSVKFLCWASAPGRLGKISLINWMAAKGKADLRFQLNYFGTLVLCLNLAIAKHWENDDHLHRWCDGIHE